MDLDHDACYRAVKLRDARFDGRFLAERLGIGERQLREPDAFSAADIGLMRALADDQGRRPSATELLVRAEAWRPWRAYAAQHPWASA